MSHTGNERSYEIKTHCGRKCGMKEKSAADSELSNELHSSHMYGEYVFWTRSGTSMFNDLFIIET